eukprot:gene12638-15870_t
MPPFRVAVLEADNSPKWEGWVEKLFRHHLEREGVDDGIWERFRCMSDEFPDPDEVDAGKYNLLLLPGSSKSAYEDAEWMRKMEVMIARYVKTGKTRILGCCFGAQILATALGGEVGKNPSGKFVLTVEKINLHTLFARLCHRGARETASWSARNNAKLAT